MKPNQQCQSTEGKTTTTIGTREIRFGQKTNEIAKFGILDDKTKFTILDKFGRKTDCRTKRHPRWRYTYHDHSYSRPLCLTRILRRDVRPKGNDCGAICAKKRFSLIGDTSLR